MERKGLADTLRGAGRSLRNYGGKVANRFNRSAVGRAFNMPAQDVMDRIDSGLEGAADFFRTKPVQSPSKPSKPKARGLSDMLRTTPINRADGFPIGKPGSREGAREIGRPDWMDQDYPPEDPSKPGIGLPGENEHLKPRSEKHPEQPSTAEGLPGVGPPGTPSGGTETVPEQIDAEVDGTDGLSGGGGTGKRSEAASNRAVGQATRRPQQRLDDDLRKKPSRRRGTTPDTDPDHASGKTPEQKPKPETSRPKTNPDQEPQPKQPKQEQTATPKPSSTQQSQPAPGGAAGSGGGPAADDGSSLEGRPCSDRPGATPENSGCVPAKDEPQQAPQVSNKPPDMPSQPKAPATEAPPALSRPEASPAPPPTSNDQQSRQAVDALNATAEKKPEAKPTKPKRVKKPKRKPGAEQGEGPIPFLEESPTDFPDVLPEESPIDLTEADVLPDEPPTETKRPSLPDRLRQGSLFDAKPYMSASGGDGGSQQTAGKIDRKTFDRLPPRAKARMVEVQSALKKATNLTPAQRVTYFNSYQKVLSRMTGGAMKAFLAGSTGGVNFYASRKELTETYIRDLVLSGDRDTAKKLYAASKKGQTVGGLYDPNGGSLHLDGGGRGKIGTAAARGRGETASSTGDPAEIYAHEFAHGIDGEDSVMSSDPEWEAAWQGEIGRRDSGDATLTKYAETDASEGFAEFGRVLLSGRHRHEDLKSSFPRAFAFWVKKGLIEDVKPSAGRIRSLFRDVFGLKIPLPKGGHLDMGMS